MGGHTAILAAAACPELVERLVVLEATVAGGADAVHLGNWFRSWPLPFASPSAALEFLGDSALSRAWADHLEPGADGGLVPPFEANVMQAELVAARPGTRRTVLDSGSHDAYLDATAEWAGVLRSALKDAPPRLA